MTAATRILLCLMLACSLAVAGTITIGSYGAAASARPFTGTEYDGLRAILANTNNFGPAGTVPHNVVVSSPVNAVDAATLAGYDVFMMSEATLSGDQAQALATWVTGGGLLVISVESGGVGAPGANLVFSFLDGSAISSASSGTNGATGGSITTSGRSSVGPFGNLVGGTFGTSIGSSLGLGSSSTVIGTSSGANFLMETAAGSGFVLTTADVVFMDFFMPSGVLYNPNNALLFENFIAGAAPAPVSDVPEPVTIVMAGAGLLAFAYIRRRR